MEGEKNTNSSVDATAGERPEQKQEMHSQQQHAAGSMNLDIEFNLDPSAASSEGGVVHKPSSSSSLQKLPPEEIEQLQHHLQRFELGSMDTIWGQQQLNQQSAGGQQQQQNVQASTNTPPSTQFNPATRMSLASDGSISIDSRRTSNWNNSLDGSRRPSNQEQSFSLNSPLSTGNGSTTLQYLQTQLPPEFLSPNQQALGHRFSGTTDGSVGSRRASDQSPETPEHLKEPRSNIFISGLAPDVVDKDLKELCEPFGNVLSAKVMLNIQTGQSRGFGFVLFEKPEQASKALEGLRGKLFRGMHLRMQFSQHKGENLTLASNRCYVRNIPLSLTNEELREHFVQYGTILNLFKPDDPQAESFVTNVRTAPNTRVIFIHFETAEEAEACVSSTHHTNPFPEAGKLALMAKIYEPSDLRNQRLWNHYSQFRMPQQQQGAGQSTAQGIAPLSANPSATTPPQQMLATTQPAAFQFVLPGGSVGSPQQYQFQQPGAPPMIMQLSNPMMPQHPYQAQAPQQQPVFVNMPSGTDGGQTTGTYMLVPVQASAMNNANPGQQQLPQRPPGVFYPPMPPMWPPQQMSFAPNSSPSVIPPQWQNRNNSVGSVLTAASSSSTFGPASSTTTSARNSIGTQNQYFAGKPIHFGPPQVGGKTETVVPTSNNMNGNQVLVNPPQGLTPGVPMRRVTYPWQNNENQNNLQQQLPFRHMSI